MLNSLFTLRLARLRELVQGKQLINASADCLALALFNPLCVCGSPPVAFARTENSGRPIPQRHSLTL